VDTMSVRGKRGRIMWVQLQSIGNPGSKLHLVCDGGGLRLTAVVTATNVTDTSMFQAVVDDVPPIRTPAGRRRARPGKLAADKGLDSRATMPTCGVWDQVTDCSAWDRVVDAAWASPLEGRAVAVVVERLAAAAGAVGQGCRRWFAFVLVACAVVCFNRL
jgi:hypothetical protein